MLCLTILVKDIRQPVLHASNICHLMMMSINGAVKAWHHKLAYKELVGQLLSDFTIIALNKKMVYDSSASEIYKSDITMGYDKLMQWLVRCKECLDTDTEIPQYCGYINMLTFKNTVFNDMLKSET
jgi:hypothetical protein